MKTDKRTQLLKILSDASQSISSAALANMLGTSERTVRNYIKAINEEGKAVITSSREGYRLESHTASLDTLPNEAESRVWKVLSDLLTSKEGVNAFDEAEALYVSSSTILNTVIPQVKEIAKEYDLRIESQKYQFYLRGSEQNRRKMIGSLAVRNTYGFFNSKDALEQLFPSQDIDGIMQELFTTCQESKLFLNDFALNNLLIHILVILIRLNIGNELDDKEPPISVDELLASSQDREDIVNLADMISANFEQKYSIRIPERDYKQILMLIALSVEHETVDIQCVISPEFIHNVASILSMMSQRYCTPEFDNDYILQFSLHMYYAQQRCAFHISYPNPIALQFKKDYAPVYDMAVYFAHRFAQIYHIEVSEDEIAFIAFHIGSYLENNKQSREHATCVVIVESYHLSKGEILSLYQKIKSAITVRQVGEMYGMEPDRHGMVCCPFHSDSDPSMKLNDTYYYCFGCGANGDAIDLTAKLFDLNPRQAAEKLMHDFGLDPDKPPANAIALPPPKRGLTDEQWADIAYCLRVLTDYLDLLHDWRKRYKPATPEEPLDKRFVEALHMTETIEHLTDCVAFGTPQQKAAAAARLLSGSYLLMLEERTDRLALAKCA